MVVSSRPVSSAPLKGTRSSPPVLLLSALLLHVLASLRVGAPRCASSVASCAMCWREAGFNTHTHVLA